MAGAAVISNVETRWHMVNSARPNRSESIAPEPAAAPADADLSDAESSSWGEDSALETEPAVEEVGKRVMSY